MRASLGPIEILIVSKMRRETKVHDFDCPVLRKHGIVKFDVQMADALTMHKL